MAIIPRKVAPRLSAVTKDTPNWPCARTGRVNLCKSSTSMISAQYGQDIQLSLSLIGRLSFPSPETTLIAKHALTCCWLGTAPSFGCICYSKRTNIIEDTFRARQWIAGNCRTTSVPAYAANIDISLALSYTTCTTSGEYAPQIRTGK